MKYIKGETTLAAKEKLTENVIELSFKLDQSINWEPGEFINLNVGDENWRSYSVLDYSGDVAKFIVDLRPNGVGSKFLKDIEVGTKIKFIGPFGKFLLTNSDKHLFICTGTGLAPVIPMIKRLITENRTDIKLLYGVRYDSEDLLHRYFSDEEFENFLVVRCITRTVRSSDVYPERVTDYMEKRSKDLSEYACYICGNPNMVTQAKKIAEEKGSKVVITEKY